MAVLCSNRILQVFQNSYYSFEPFQCKDFDSCILGNRVDFQSPRSPKYAYYFLRKFYRHLYFLILKFEQGFNSLSFVVFGFSLQEIIWSDFFIPFFWSIVERIVSSYTDRSSRPTPRVFKLYSGIAFFLLRYPQTAST